MIIDTHIGWGMLARNLDPLQGGIPVFLLVSCCPFIIPFLVPPRFISPLRNTSVLISTTMNLTCTVTADPEASIRWLKDDAENIPGAIYSQGNAILVLKNVTLTDEGWYTCLVKNRAGNATSEAYIEITGTDLCSELRLVLIFCAIITTRMLYYTIALNEYKHL